MSVTIGYFSTLTCPQCQHPAKEKMPADACQFFYDCPHCGAVLRPKPGVCCVFCSYGDVACPPVQQQAQTSAALTRIKAVTGGAIGLGAVASFIGMCCIGPWAVALFGVSGAITLARFDFLRPWIMGAAAVLLAWAYWRVYRPQPVCVGGTCAAGPSRLLKTSLWVATIMLVVAFFAEQIQWLILNYTGPGALR